MSKNTILILQSIGITLQMVNAGLSGVTENPTVTLLLAAVVGGYQFYVQRIGASEPSGRRQR